MACEVRRSAPWVSSCPDVEGTRDRCEASSTRYDPFSRALSAHGFLNCQNAIDERDVTGLWALTVDDACRATKCNGQNVCRGCISSSCLSLGDFSFSGSDSRAFLVVPLRPNFHYPPQV